MLHNAEASSTYVITIQERRDAATTGGSVRRRRAELHQQYHHSPEELPEMVSSHSTVPLTCDTHFALCDIFICCLIDECVCVCVCVALGRQLVFWVMKSVLVLVLEDLTR